jgi:hypothetical protein
MANDPNTIQYVIQEDGFWYVASKDRTPGVPEITVSAKGVANGLSTEYNDGYDFGPDSYDPNSTANPPYTQTSGIMEGVNYVASNTYFPPSPSSTSSGIPYNAYSLRLLNGYFYVNENITLPSESTGFIMEISGMGEYQTVILLANGLTGFTGSVGYKFIMKNLTFGQQNTNDIPVSAVNLSANGTNTTERFDFENITFTNSYPATSYSSGAVILDNVSARSVFFRNVHWNLNNSYCVYATGTGALNTMIVLENDTPVSGLFYFNGINTVVFTNYNFYRGEITVGNINKLVLNNVNNYSMGTMISLVNNVYSLEWKNSIFINSSTTSTPVIALASGVSSAVVYDMQLYNIYTGFSASNPLFGSGISIHAIKWEAIFNGWSYSLQLPTSASASGTTAGTVSINSSEYGGNYKRYVITFDGYENDTTTNQTIDYPLAFASYAGISLNTTGLTISTTTSGIVITAPDATTTYSGIVIVEGY